MVETPCYFGTLEQAQQIHIDFALIPTYFADRYELQTSDKDGANLRPWRSG